MVEGRGAARRVPALIHFWTWPERFGARADEVRSLLDRYPQDAQVLLLRMPGLTEGPAGDPSYCWVRSAREPAASAGALDGRGPLDSWDSLDEVLAALPDPRRASPLAQGQPDDGRYRIAGWMSCLFERHWALRGLENALTDFALWPVQVHRLYRALTDFSLVLMQRARDELGADAILTTDDLGAQRGPLFGIDTFRGFLAPFYGELIACAHRLGMHFWLHSCGDVGLFLPELIGLGLDVIHPLQKHAMDAASASRAAGGRICAWAGVDVQWTLPFGTPADVRAEVGRLRAAWQRPEGRMLLGPANMVHADCSTENLAALLEEAYRGGGAAPG